ncbi:MAG TPA: ribose 5-phosphate isomerase B [Armatimonadota bacterium]|nr:ribose 5-phosphate isomerase B [Armatimonadota bacterium]
MRIGLGSDDLGFRLKEQLRSHLADRKDVVLDYGAFSEEPVDYPDIAVTVAEAVLAGIVDRGILVCGTGLGMAIAANKVPGIFAAPVTDIYTARLACERNAVQIITLGANILGCGVATAIVDAWLSAEFQGGQSARKVARIREIEGRYHLQGVPALALR